MTLQDLIGKKEYLEKYFNIRDPIKETKNIKIVLENDRDEGRQKLWVNLMESNKKTRISKNCATFDRTK